VKSCTLMAGIMQWEAQAAYLITSKTSLHKKVA